MPRPRPLAHYTLGCLLSLLALLGSAAVHAEQSFGEKTVRLSAFTPHTGPIRMHGISESVDIYLPLASTATISDTWLDLQLIHSIVLLGERSSIRVLFNETTLAQIPYNPEQPMANARVRIPDELWRSGFNKLTLSVIQHYIDRCEDSTSPELWTEIDLHNSILSYTVQLADSPLQLRDLSGLFSPGIGGLGNILLLSSPDADLTDGDSSYLTATLPLVAQSLALRRDYSPLKFEHARWNGRRAAGNTPRSRQTPEALAYLPQGRNPEGHVLIGTRDELASLLPPSLTEQINGPFLHLARVDTQRDGTGASGPGQGVRLIVSGTSGSEVRHAARVLAQTDDGLSALQQLKVLGDDRQAVRLSGAGSYFLQPDTRYTFAELGRHTTTLQGAGAKRITVNLPIRGNFYTHESATVDLLLDFAYGAGMGTGSVMSVFLNGEYVHGQQLRQPNGAAFRGYRISLPARKLQPGTNTLEFEFSLRAETVAGECRSIPASHLIVQMLESSTVTLPKASAVAIQPDLGAMSATAFPYIANTHTVRTELAVASEEMLGNALSLAGKLAQLSRSPAEQLRVRTTIPATLNEDTIVLATPSELPAGIFESVSDSLERSQRLSYRILNQLRPANAGQSQDPSRLLAGTLAHSGGLDSLGVMMSMRNPHSPKAAALTVISAADHALLTQRVLDLLSPQIWGQLRGDLVVWEGPNDPVVAMQVNDYYEIGERDRWQILAMTFSNNPWYMLAVLLVVIFIIGLLARGYLRDREAQKLAE